ncbi:MAG: 50S ribosomal protein L21e [Methanomicrobia archaeon]|nr:50S ribosomal protein L21e [Methanomicrobia archaeon]HDM22788.1 50S ribosomal protein L21e [Methanomicrobia archaeon]
MERSRGFRTKSRGKLTKRYRDKNLNIISRLLVNYNNGDKVHLVLEPSIHRGMPHPKFHGLTGTIVGKRGNSYLVKIRDKKKEKIIISRPEHLRKQEI